MKLKILKIFLIFIICFLFFVSAKYVSASWADYLVISEIQITGGSGKTTNDFIELYNPTTSSINLNGLRLVKRTKTGTTDTLIKSWTDDVLIPAHGFYLWANSNYTEIPTVPDVTTTGSISDDNGIAIRFGPNDTGTIIDSLGWGDCQNIFVETNTSSTPPVNPGANESLERKPGGNDGNGEDTDDNFNDFFIQINPNPQNLLSSPLPLIVGTVCGNSLCETGEDSQNCPQDCPVQENPVCGNSIKEIGEDCDSPDLNEKTCYLLGWISGSLSCNHNCTFNTSNCTNVGSGGGSSEKIYNSSDLTINELVSDPTDDENEWIELYNRTDQTINLENWTLEDGTEIETKLSGEITAKGFKIIENLKFSLNNAGDIVILRSPKSDLIDQVTYGNWNDGDLNNNAPTAPDPKSLARINDGGDSNNDFLDFQVTGGKSKGFNNKILGILKEADQTIILNELLPNPIGDDEAGELIEVKNIGDQNIDLAGWKIEDASGSSYSILTKDFVSTIVESHKFFVLKREITGIALNNTGGEVIKFYNSAGQLVDNVSYEGSIKENYAYARDEDREWQWTNQLTPNAENIFDSNLENNKGQDDENTLVKIIISEVLPNPVGNDNEEWLELYNADSQEVNLKNWQLDDQDGGSVPYKIKNDLIIKPGQYLIFKKEETKISFNNSEDEVRLLNPNNKIIEEVPYEDVREGFSYARDGDNWFWTSTPTLGNKNSIKEAEDNKLLDDKNLNSSQTLPIELADIRQVEIGTKIKTSGIVSVEPGILGTQIFYLAGSGVQVYFYRKDFPNLKIGDLIEVNGEISEYRGETRIKVAQKSDIKIVKRNQEVKIHQIKIDQIGESLEGSLVSIEGQLIESTGSYLYLDDGTGEIKVYIKTGADIKKPKIKEGDWLKITGIVSQYDEEYRLLPRFQDDIILLGEENNKNNFFDMAGSLSTVGNLSNKNIFEKINDLGVAKYFIVSTLFLAIVLVGLLIKKKK